MTPWTVAHQAPLSMGFSRPEYWSGLPLLSPGDLVNPGIKPRSPTLQADSLPPEPPNLPVEQRGSAQIIQHWDRKAHFQNVQYGCSPTERVQVLLDPLEETASSKERARDRVGTTRVCIFS